MGNEQSEAGILSDLKTLNLEEARINHKNPSAKNNSTSDKMSLNKNHNIRIGSQKEFDKNKRATTMKKKDTPSYINKNSQNEDGSKKKKNDKQNGEMRKSKTLEKGVNIDENNDDFLKTKYKPN